QIGVAISLIHEQADKSWTVQRLAARVGMSRTAFALRFGLVVGESPLRYLTRCRIARAGSLLRSSALTVGAIAEAVGYTSEVAFRKAFKRHVGAAPGQFRRSPPIPAQPRVARVPR